MLKTVASIVGTFALVGTLAAQPPAFKRTVLQQSDISAPGREVVSAVADFDAGATPGPHMHPGEEIGYVLEGTFLVEQAGKPAVTLQTGGSFLIPAGTVHNATNQGTGKGRILATYIVEKGKPLATPAR